MQPQTPYPDIGQPCSGIQCAGEHPYCPDCEAAVEEFERSRWREYYAGFTPIERG